MTAERQVGFDAILDRGETEVVEPVHGRGRERLVGKVGERRPAPEPERSAEIPGRAVRIARGERFAAGAGKLREAVEVDLLRIDLQRVPVAVALEGDGVAVALKELPQPRDVDV